MLPPYYFFWLRIDIKHMTETWLDQELMDSAYRSAAITTPPLTLYSPGPERWVQFHLYIWIQSRATGCRSTFDFPSRVNLSGPYCTESPRHWVSKADTPYSNLLLLQGQRCMSWRFCFEQRSLINLRKSSFYLFSLFSSYFPYQINSRFTSRILNVF